MIFNSIRPWLFLVFARVSHLFSHPHFAPESLDLMNATKKRKLEAATPQDTAKRVKIMSESSQQTSTPAPASSAQVLPPAQDSARESQKEQLRTSARKNITKLVPPRPFPTVPTSVAATGPHSSHREGRNLICLTRRTKLGAYMRRCKNLLLQDG